MLSPSDLLRRAEDLASRIPLDSAYEEERNPCWIVVGEESLRQEDVIGAIHALRSLTDPPQQARLRLAISAWLMEHPGDGGGRAVLRGSIDQMAYWEEWFSRRDISRLVPVVHREFGEDVVRQMAGQLTDPFTKSNTLVTLARLQGAGVGLDTLREAERISDTVGCDRDFALRWVLNGYVCGRPCSRRGARPL